MKILYFMEFKNAQKYVKHYENFARIIVLDE